MKFTLVVRQAAVVDAGLIGKVNANDLCFLDYLRGWLLSQNSKRQVVDGRKFVWIHYERAIEELPLLFNPQSQTASRKNQLAALIQKLRKLELVETQKIGRRLFFRLTDLAIRVTQRSERLAPTAAKPASVVTPPHDGNATPANDEAVTLLRDNYLPPNIDETGTTKSETKETPPISPWEGDAESILAFWNSCPELPKAISITGNRARKIQRRLADPWWREHWREGVKRAAASSFLTGNGAHGWRATFDWFLGGDSLAKVLEGNYDNRPRPDRIPLPSELKAQIKAVEELIACHPANDESTFSLRDATKAEREDLRELYRRRKELVRQLAGLPTVTQQPGYEDSW
ncbi:MAG TPA: hypothetical protein VMJ12_09490 [Candidatus Acidoferrales bacterium]|nr:hypothetical protein [Candidatus Acidoferrales bacterium]